jgi:hypothetical protein
MQTGSSGGDPEVSPLESTRGNHATETTSKSFIDPHRTPPSLEELYPNYPSIAFEHFKERAQRSEQDPSD